MKSNITELTFLFSKVFFKGRIVLLAIENEAGATQVLGYNNNVTSAGSIFANSNKPVRQLMLNLSTGERDILNIETIQNLLKDEPELLKQFNKDKKKKSRLAYYVQMYNNRYPFYVYE